MSKFVEIWDWRDGDPSLTLVNTDHIVSIECRGEEACVTEGLWLYWVTTTNGTFMACLTSFIEGEEHFDDAKKLREFRKAYLEQK